ncbi:hypothetical protein WR25_03425 [Diploscapter pachys]|uniref:Uncharacterized protein n=1 Tax=Diploscapter pachys TaxID=2018661 RepID=A0A2A2J7F9_9BILA|nr:hypothetical protein WR25_03425 [Diploscapter pachys]
MENGQKVIVEREGPGNLEEILEDVVYEETVGEMGDELPDDYIDVDINRGGARIVNGREGMIQDNIFTTYLPFRDGMPCLTLNLPDLMSRAIVFENGVKIWICFSKKCQKQLALEGHLYNLNGAFNEHGWTQWSCATPNCPGSISTGPGFSELRVRTGHECHCIPDDLQVRLRINVYDLRLMAEFTDLGLHDLYEAFVAKLQGEQPDCAEIFPLFTVLLESLEYHRINKTYRKRFEAENLREKQRITQVPLEEFVELQNNPNHYVGFRRTRPFPVSICMECQADFRSADVPSQDQLVEHVGTVHNRPLVIERYKFNDILLFEQWLRDFGIHSKQKMKRMGLCDEHMYYLCTHDDRLQKSTHTRIANGMIHCTAFIRIHDWRIVSRREVSEVTVDYCLDHCFHEDPNPRGNHTNLIDYFSPEVFVRDVEERKARTQRLLTEHSNRQGVLRRFTGDGLSTLMQATRPMKGGGSGVRALAPPMAAQLAGAAGSFGDIELAEDSWQSAQLHPPHIPRKDSVASRKSLFPDAETFNTVVQLEQHMDMLKERMQLARNAETAHSYLLRIAAILEDALADPNCAPGANKNPHPQVQKPQSSRSRKRASAGGEEEDLEMPLLDSSVKLEFQAQTIPGPTQGEMCALKEIVEGPTKKSQTSTRQAAKQAQANAESTSEAPPTSSKRAVGGKSTEDEGEEPAAKKQVTETPRRGRSKKASESEANLDMSNRADSPTGSQTSVTRSGRVRKPPPKYYE